MRKKQRNRFADLMREAAKYDPFEVAKYEAWLPLLRGENCRAERKRLGLKLLLIADTHGDLALKKQRLPDYLDSVGVFDLCVLLGDIHPAEMPIILDCIPREEIVAVKGNHDSFSVYRDFGIRDISGAGFVYRGVRFAGMDGSFRYKDEAFPSHTQYESLLIARALPEADVFLTHDVMLDGSHRDPAHAGLIGIADYLYHNSPQWHIHGHIHQSYEREYDNGTREKSVYLCEHLEI